MAVLATAAAVAAVAARDGGEDTRVTSAVPGSAATPPTEATATTVASATTAAAPAVTTTAPAAPTTTVAPSPATAVAPAPAAVPPATAACRNSDDPACGPFRFDPPPAADRPMTLTVTTEPAVVTAGTEVVFRVTLNDPDGVDYNGTIVEYGDEVGLGASQVKACGKHGPWDPPAPDPASALEVVEYRHVYAAPGTYTARFAFDAGPFDCTDAATGVGDRPYASSASGEMTVVVVAP